MPQANQIPLDPQAKEVIEDALHYLVELSTNNARYLYTRVWNELAKTVLHEAANPEEAFTYSEVYHTIVNLDGDRWFLPIYKALSHLCLCQLIMLPAPAGKVRCLVYGVGPNIKFFLALGRALFQRVNERVKENKAERGSRSLRGPRGSDTMVFRSRLMEDIVAEIKSVLIIHEHNSLNEPAFKAYRDKLYAYHKRTGLDIPTAPVATETTSPLRVS